MSSPNKLGSIQGTQDKGSTTENELKQAILHCWWDDVLEIFQAHESLKLRNKFGIWKTLLKVIHKKLPEEVVLSMVKHSTKEVLKQQFQNDGSTVLHHLAWHGYTLAMELALSLTSDDHVDVQTKDGQTPLHLCLCNEELTFDDHKKMSVLLLKHGASVDLKDIGGETPIDCYRNNKCKKYEDVKAKKEAELLKILSARRTEVIRSCMDEPNNSETTMVNSRIIVFSITDTGKTSLINKILGKKFNEGKSLINGPAATAVVQHFAKWKELDKDCKWEKQEIDAWELTRERYEWAIAEKLAEKLKPDGKQQITSDQSTSNGSMCGTSFLTENEEHTFRSEKRDTGIHNSTRTNKAAHDSIPESILQKVVEKLNVESTADNKEGMASVWDCGGQLLNYTTKQFFLTCKSSYNVVFSLLDKLDELRRISLSDDFKATNLQLILFSIRTIYEHAVLNSLAKPRLDNGINLPPITVVATHKDQIDTSEAEKIVNTIIGAVKDKPYKMHVAPEVIKVDCTKLNDEGIWKLKRNACNYMKDMAETVPISLDYFQSKIEDIGRTRLQLPLVEISKIAVECGISKTNLPSALYYLNDIGVIFYTKTNKKLKDTVVVNLHKMNDMIMRIITGEMYCSLMIDSLNKFNEKGILEEELLHHFWKPEIEIDASNFNVALEFMKMLGLIFEKDIHQGKRQFLVTSRIKMKTLGLEVKKDEKHTVSIYVTPTDILPGFVNCVLAVGFLNLMKCKGRDLDISVLYQNRSDFDMYKDHLVKLGEVTIGNKRALKLEISRKNSVDGKIREPCASVCIELSAYLKDQLKNLCCTMENVGYELRVSCNSCDLTAQPDLHKLNECIEKDYVTCAGKSVDTSQFKYLFTTDSMEFSTHGGTMRFNDITLHIPKNAIKNEEKVRVYIKTIKNEKIDILKPTHETLLSPVVFCGPPGTKFDKPCLLSFPHNIVDEKNWKFKGLVKDRRGGKWKEIIEKDENFTCYVKNGRCFIKLKHFTYYALGGGSAGVDTAVGEAAGGNGVKHVHMKVLDYWHRYLPNTYNIRVQTWTKDCDKPKDRKPFDMHYIYPLATGSVTISVGKIAEGWTAKPKLLPIHKDLVRKPYAGIFQLKADETQMAKKKKRPTCKVWIKQNGVKQKPSVRIPQDNGHHQETDNTGEGSYNVQARFDSSCSDEFETLCFDFSEHYNGNNCKWLIFLLHGIIPLVQLSQHGRSALGLIKQLKERGIISHDNIVILSEIAELTSLKSAKSCIAEYKSIITECKEGQVLKQHRKTLFKALMQVEHSELPKLIYFYNLARYMYDIADIWDLVFRLETAKRLDTTPKKWNKFARLLNPTAQEIMLEILPSTSESSITENHRNRRFTNETSRNEKAIMTEAAETDLTSELSISSRLRKRKLKTTSETCINQEELKRLSIGTILSPTKKSKKERNTTRKYTHNINRNLHLSKKRTKESMTGKCIKSQKKISKDECKTRSKKNKCTNNSNLRPLTRRTKARKM